MCHFQRCISFNCPPFLSEEAEYKQLQFEGACHFLLTCGGAATSSGLSAFLPVKDERAHTASYSRRHSGPGRAPNLVRALTQTPSLVTSSCPDLVDTKNEVNVGPQYVEGSRGVDQNNLVCGPESREQASSIQRTGRAFSGSTAIAESLNTTVKCNDRQLSVRHLYSPH